MTDDERNKLVREIEWQAIEQAAQRERYKQIKGPFPAQPVNPFGLKPFTLDDSINQFKSELQRQVDAALARKADERVAHIEAYIRTYLLETGATVDQIELCEEHRGLTTVWYFRNREPKP